MFNRLLYKQLKCKTCWIALDCNFHNREYLRKFCNPAACISSATFWMGNLSSCLTNFASSLSPNKINFNISKVESGPWLNQFAQRWKVQILIFSDSSATHSILLFSLFSPDCPFRIVHPLPGKGQIGQNNLEYTMYTSRKETVRKRSTT